MPDAPGTFESVAGIVYTDENPVAPQSCEASPEHESEQLTSIPFVPAREEGAVLGFEAGALHRSIARACQRRSDARGGPLTPHGKRALRAGQ